MDCDGLQFQCSVDTRQSDIYEVLDGLSYDYYYRAHGYFAGIGSPDPVFVIQYLYVRAKMPHDVREWFSVSELLGQCPTVPNRRFASAEASVDDEAEFVNLRVVEAGSGTEDDIPF